MIELNVLPTYLLNKGLSLVVFSLILTLFLVPLFIKISHKFNIFDYPDGKLKVQKKRVPYLGGLAVFFGFIITLMCFDVINNLNIYFLIGLFFLIILGLIDDLYALKPHLKLFGQIFASFFFLYSLGSELHINYYFYPFILFWFLTIINSFNLIDVMDGLATISALCVSLPFFIYFYLFDNLNYFFILAAFIGALFGFFYYNKPSAKIYLGDTGSLFIGGFLAYISLILLKGNLNMDKPIILYFSFAVPILELVALIAIRMYKKIPIYLGSPDHFSMYMQKKGWSKYQILIFVLLLSTMFFANSYLFIFNIFNLLTTLFFNLIILVAWFFIVY